MIQVKKGKAMDFHHHERPRQSLFPSVMCTRRSRVCVCMSKHTSKGSLLYQHRQTLTHCRPKKKKESLFFPPNEKCALHVALYLPTPPKPAWTPSPIQPCVCVCVCMINKKKRVKSKDTQKAQCRDACLCVCVQTTAPQEEGQVRCTWRTTHGDVSLLTPTQIKPTGLDMQVGGREERVKVCVCVCDCQEKTGGGEVRCE